MSNNAHRKLQERLEHLKAAVKQAGIKLTHQRLEIFREIASSSEHPEADTIFRAVQQRVPTVSLDTVYRTLWMLHGLGLITTLGPEGNAVRFDANLDQHHHYVCTRCGLVRDFESADLNALRVPDTVKEIGSIACAQVEVRGVCTTCLAQQAAVPSASPKQPPKHGGAHHE